MNFSGTTSGSGSITFPSTITKDNFVSAIAISPNSMVCDVVYWQNGTAWNVSGVIHLYTTPTSFYTNQSVTIRVLYLDDIEE